MSDKECFWCGNEMERYEDVEVSWFVEFPNKTRRYKICKKCAREKGLI